MRTVILGLLFPALGLLACDDSSATADPSAGPSGGTASGGSTGAGGQAGEGGAVAGGGASAGSGLVINEVMTSPTNGATDWVELFVAGADAVDTTGYTLVDDKDGREPAPLPALTIGAGDFLVLPAAADGIEGEGPYLPFGLGSTDGLTLARNGEVIDALAWTDAELVEGATHGRLPDGAPAAQALEPTPGAPNQALGAPAPAYDPFPADRVIEVRLELPEASWQAILDAPLEEAYYTGNMVYDDQRVEDVAIRVKGNSSLMSVVRSRDDRFSFKIDVNRNVDQDFHGLRKLNLNNGYHDPSMMREHLSYGILRGMGLPASRTVFVDVWLNAEHMGLYTAVEHVDGHFLDVHFGDNDGLLYKPSGRAGSLSWQGSEPNAYEGLDPQRGDTPDIESWMGLLAAITEQPGAAPLESLLDVQGALRYLAAIGTLGTLDSYIGPAHNFYVYDLEGRFTIIPWDFNGAFGIFNCGCNRDAVVGFALDEPSCWQVSERPLVQRLMANDGWREAYRGYVLEMLDGPLAAETFEASVNATAALIEPFVAADERAFYTVAEFRENLHEDHVERDGRVLPGLTVFVRDRAASIRAQIAGELPSTRNGMGNCERRRPRQ